MADFHQLWENKNFTNPSLEIYESLISYNQVKFAHIGNYVKRPTLYPSSLHVPTKVLGMSIQSSQEL